MGIQTVQAVPGRASYGALLSMATSGFLINPLLESDGDLIAVANGEAPHQVETFRVAVERGSDKLFKRRVTIAWSELTRSE